MKRPLRTVFFGTPAFAVPSFRATLAQSEVLGVVTQPDRPRGRGMKILPCEVKEAALAEGLPAFSPKSLRKGSDELRELLAALDRLRPDLFVVTAYGNLLPQDFLDRPRLGSINVHASLLPRWRGAAPIQRAVEAGDPETGVCLQKMVMELDAGDVLAEKRSPIAGSETSGDLFARLADDGGRLLANYLSGLDPDQGLRGQTQDPAGVTFAKKLTKEEALWSPEWSATESDRRIRAFFPWPVVKAQLEGGPELKILKASLSDHHAKATPGELILNTDGVFLACAVRTSESSAFLRLEQIQMPGKGPVAAADFFRNFISAQKSPPATGQKSPRLVKLQQ